MRLRRTAPACACGERCAAPSTGVHFWRLRRRCGCLQESKHASSCAKRTNVPLRIACGRSFLSSVRARRGSISRSGECDEIGQRAGCHRPGGLPGASPHPGHENGEQEACVSAEQKRQVKPGRPRSHGTVQCCASKQTQAESALTADQPDALRSQCKVRLARTRCSGRARSGRPRAAQPRRLKVRAVLRSPASSACRAAREKPAPAALAKFQGPEVKRQVPPAKIANSGRPHNESVPAFGRKRGHTGKRTRHNALLPVIMMRPCLIAAVIFTTQHFRSL